MWWKVWSYTRKVNRWRPCHAIIKLSISILRMWRLSWLEAPCEYLINILLNAETNRCMQKVIFIQIYAYILILYSGGCGDNSAYSTNVQAKRVFSLYQSSRFFFWEKPSIREYSQNVSIDIGGCQACSQFNLGRINAGRHLWNESNFLYFTIKISSTWLPMV